MEPYFGGGAVLFAKPDDLIEGHSEVVNDLNGELVNFWRVLKRKESLERLQVILSCTPFAELEFNASKPGGWYTHKSASNIELAAAFFIRYRQSRQGLGRDFATLTRNRVRRGMNEQVSSWLSAIEGLPEASERLRRVVILNRDAVEVIDQQDGLNTFFYLDPPYLHETRSTTKEYGPHEMDSDQHCRLLNALEEVQGKFILSGYRSEMYDEFARRNNWLRVDIPIDNKASSKKKKDIQVECLWMNYRWPKSSGQ